MPFHFKSLKLKIFIFDFIAYYSISYIVKPRTDVNKFYLFKYY